MTPEPQRQRTMISPMQFRMKLRADGTWQWRLLDHRPVNAYRLDAARQALIIRDGGARADRGP